MRWLLPLLLCLSLGLPARGATLPDPTRFSVVIETGDLEQARRWLDDGLPPDFEGSVIGSGLMIGAWEGNIPMMALFHARGADINKTNALGEQALLHAAWKGRLDAVRWLVERGARLDRLGKEWSALHYAAFAGHGDVVAYLLERGANANALSTNGSTPLMMAVRESKEGIIDRLLAAGAYTDVVNEWGDTAATWAMRRNDVALARKLSGEGFARLAAQPQSNFAALPRSQPLPDRADRLLAEARRLESFGRFAEAAKVYRAAFAAVKQAEAVQARTQKAAARARTVTGVTITARRDNPGAQSAGLAYATPATGPAAAGPSAAKVDTGGTAAPQQQAAQDVADQWLRLAREHEAAGRRQEAMAAYRAASQALRGR